VHLVFDIFQGIGVAAVVGVRPFLPTLAVGALAAGDVQIDFVHSSFSFLQSTGFLLGMVLGVIALAVLEARLLDEQLERGPIALAIAGVSLALGALLFAGSLARGGYAVWPGIVGGVVCAGIGILATRPLLARVRARLQGEAGAVLPLVVEVAAVITAVLVVVVPPVGVVVLGLLLWLLIAGRARGEQKFAGLRILR
jgi:hypothetical protein